MCHSTTTSLLLAVSSALAPTGDAGTPRPDLAEIAERGRQTLEKLEEHPATWRAVHSSLDESVFEVSVARQGDKGRYELSHKRGWRSTPLLTVIEHGDVWYVSELGQRPTKYRRLEAPVNLVGAYNYLTRSDPYVILDPTFFDDMSFVGMTEQDATFRRRLQPDEERRVSQAAAIFRQTRSGSDPDPAQLRTLRSLDLMLENGVELRLDLETGILVRSGQPSDTIEIRDFRWRDRLDQEFLVDDQRYEDHTASSFHARPEDLMMILHNPRWKPGAVTDAVDAVLVNISTKEVRRVPFEGVASAPGCFSKDRTKVYVAGEDHDMGGYVLAEIDLRTGENRRLCVEPLFGHMIAMPRLSNDGTRLAMVASSMDPGTTHLKDAVANMLAFQVCVVDIESDSLSRIGEARDQAFVSWLPGDKELLLLVREGGNSDRQTGHTICRMTLDGKVTPILEGDWPLLIPPGKTFLFRNLEDDLWYIADTDVQNVRRIGDGLPRHGFPAVSPRGDRAVIMRYGGDDGPVPVLVSLPGGSSTPMNLGKGLWATPAWE